MTQNSKTNTSEEGTTGRARTGRRISARVENIVRLTEEYHYKGSNMTMSLLELKEVMESKKKLYWKLKREMDCCSEHFKGNSNALKSISVTFPTFNANKQNFSESAFQNRHQSEQVHKKLSKLDDDNQQLMMKKDRIQKLIKTEQFKLGV
jgi:hypothetical protein